MPSSLTAFVVATPGLSDLLAAELRELGLSPAETTNEGVLCTTDLAGLYRTNLCSRLATRVVVRIAEFEAAHFSVLEKRASRVPWQDWIADDVRLGCRVTCRKSRLYHSGAVAERVLSAVARVVRFETAAADEEDETPSQLLLVRISNDRCTVSLDSSGALLHRRGYRLAVARAPLRETMAAAMLRACGWTGTTPVIDPMCGSGTIPIEAALLARRMAPGRSRTFAFQQWPAFDALAWARVHERAREAELPRSPVQIAGSDRDAGAIEAATANARRAGVASDIDFRRQALSATTPPEGMASGLMLTNPPWGGRVGESRSLRDLYARLGQLLDGPFAGWTAGVLAADPGLLRHTRVALTPAFTTSIGGIDASLAVRR
jgi:putative N6-adenine-specific DNA methylase